MNDALPIIEHLKGKIKNLTLAPGVYLMKDRIGTILYVGKASSLKKRVSSYFNRPVHPDAKTSVLVSKIADFEVIVTESEKEALILESNLIKRHRPRYNVLLKDGKRYPSLCLHMDHPFPNLTIIRKTDQKEKRYFGPYASANAVRQTLKIVNKTFTLRKCKNSEFKIRTRPCLHYQMQACLGPCCLEVPAEAYAEIVKEVTLFLKGRTPDLIREVKQQMFLAAEQEEFERAALLRDKIQALQTTLEKQVAVTTDLMDRDVLGMAADSEETLVTLLEVRQGYIVGSRNYHLTHADAPEGEVMDAFIRQYYESAPFIPKEVLAPVCLEDEGVLSEWLGTLKSERVSILHPVRGEKRRLIQMAMENAATALREQRAARNEAAGLLVRLQKRLKMKKVPRRIACFDNSNIGGTQPVAAMVVFEDARPLKSAYRKYRIRSVTGPDDYASMAEVLTRRFEKPETEAEPFPDLLMVDGGKGQLGIAVSVMNALGLSGRFEMVGIAKKDPERGETEDKIFQPGRQDAVNFRQEPEVLRFLERIRDEAHRFAVGFHRARRAKESFQSVLDGISGIGKNRKSLLLQHFENVEKIRAATLDELSGLPGMNRKAAEAVLSALSSK